MTDAKSPEPSIEEILASIRKIISDDDPDAETPPAVAPAASPSTSADAEDDVLELTDVVFTAPAEDEPDEEPPHASPEPAADPAPIDTSNVTVLQQLRAEMPQQAIDSELVSSATIAAASGAIAKLAHVENQDAGSLSYRSGGPSVEDLARELLKPMLRQWIDQNLPSLVERLVERELRKITRKAEDL